ncbi:MAG: hypothetical protein MR867_04575 [Eubacterium sp.]|nr:hypothetical protein [Eubacterium sp.]MDD7209174.1 hypothetical protein [Lachnospiraceae bacterium]MDY5497084.1 hypothetical protein [Anaerobutyricum sp.]
MGTKSKSEEKKIKEKTEVINDMMQTLQDINAMMDSFIATEAEGMVICENCFDNMYEDEDGVCHLDDEEGISHYFCCKECMQEWEKKNKK